MEGEGELFGWEGDFVCEEGEEAPAGCFFVDGGVEGELAGEVGDFGGACGGLEVPAEVG